MCVCGFKVIVVSCELGGFLDGLGVLTELLVGLADDLLAFFIKFFDLTRSEESWPSMDALVYCFLACGMFWA